MSRLRPLSKVICVRDKDNMGQKIPYCTKGELYEVVSYSLTMDRFYIKTEDESIFLVERINFVTLEEWRESVIDKLLNENTR